MVDEHVVNQVGVGETQYNVAGNVDNSVTTINNHHHVPNHDAKAGEAESSESGSGSGAVAATGGGIGGLIALVVVGYLLFGGDEPFPTTSDPWPNEVKKDAVIAATSSWLDKCAKSTSATPANCPQSVAEASGSRKVHWTLYGNPTEAPVIYYSKAESRFDVLGTVVVSAEYTVANEAHRVVTPTTYWAKIKWADGRLDVQEIKRHSAVGDPQVTKQDPKLAWEPMAAKLQGAFSRCVRGAKSAMPTGCPEWSPPPGAKKIKWSATGDPILTARPKFDRKFGIYRVKGTYGLSVRYTWLGSAKTETRNPNYEAWIAPTASGPVVLKIEDTNTI